MRNSLFHLALLLSLCLSGCGSVTPTEPPPSSIKAIDKATIAAVQVALKNDPVLAGCQIKVTAENDTVVLNGDVPNEEAKHNAEIMAKKTEGVAHVANHLNVTNEPVPGQ